MEVMRLRNLVILTIVIVLTLVVAACGQGGATPEPEAPAPEAPAPAQEAPAEAPAEEAEEEETETAEDRGEVVWMTASESPALDPAVENDAATSDITTQMMEGLMWYAPGNILEPLLAESYEVLDGNLRYRFSLRQGVTFHDGEPFNAEAVKISLDRVLDPENAFPGTFIIEMIDYIEVVDNYTVDIVLQFPFSPFTAHLSHQVAFIQSPAAIAAGTTNTHPIGTGPFMFAYRVHGDYTRMVPNPNHWRATPAHELIFRLIPDAATRVAMINTGDANAFAGVASMVHEFYGMPHIDWWRIQTSSLTYIGFNTDPDTRDGARDETSARALADPRVRRAITMAINKMDILHGVQEGEGVVGAGPVRGGLINHAPNVPGLPFDPDAARELLAEAGFPDGFSTSIWTNYGNPVRARMTELIQANLAVIGIDVDIQIIEWGAYLEDTAAGLHDMFILGWVTMTGDADYGIYPLFHSNEIGGGNRSQYNNPEVDRLLEEARMSVVPAERDRLYQEVTEILIYEAPMIFAFHPDNPVATNGIDGLFVDFTVTPHFFNVTLR